MLLFLTENQGFTSVILLFQKRMGVAYDFRSTSDKSVSKLNSKMLKQIVSPIKSEDWFVTKDAYFHISILP